MTFAKLVDSLIETDIDKFDFSGLINGQIEDYKLTQDEMKALDDSLYDKAIEAQDALENYLSTLQALGTWSSDGNNGIKYLVYAYNHLTDFVNFVRREMDSIQDE
jgi:hypothetical protein